MSTNGWLSLRWLHADLDQEQEVSLDDTLASVHSKAREGPVSWFTLSLQHPGSANMSLTMTHYLPKAQFSLTLTKFQIIPCLHTLGLIFKTDENFKDQLTKSCWHELSQSLTNTKTLWGLSKCQIWCLEKLESGASVTECLSYTRVKEKWLHTWQGTSGKTQRDHSGICMESHTAERIPAFLILIKINQTVQRSREVTRTLSRLGLQKGL